MSDGAYTLTQAIISAVVLGVVLVSIIGMTLFVLASSAEEERRRKNEQARTGDRLHRKRRR